MGKDDSINLRCISNTLNFIENNYDQIISVKELEVVSNYSYRNIQRIFKYTCGITIGAYQQQLKVEHAYKLILFTKASLTSIAYKVGFANLASFSKAFKQHFGIPPKQARSNKEILLSAPGIKPIGSEVLLRPEIIYIPPLTVYYESVFTYYAYHEIEMLWQNFMQNEFPDAETVYFGVIVDEPLIKEELICRYDACSSVQAKNKKLNSKKIFGGRYAQFIHPGGYHNIEETYEKIYSRWILESGFELDSTPIIEKYLKHPDNTNRTDEQLTCILIPLK